MDRHRSTSSCERGRDAAESQGLRAKSYRHWELLTALQINLLRNDQTRGL